MRPHERIATIQLFCSMGRICNTAIVADITDYGTMVSIGGDVKQLRR